MGSALLTPFVRSWLLCTYSAGFSVSESECLFRMSRLHRHSVCSSLRCSTRVTSALVSLNSGPRRSQDHETRRWHYLRRLRLYLCRPLFEHHLKLDCSIIMFQLFLVFVIVVGLFSRALTAPCTIPAPPLLDACSSRPGGRRRQRGQDV